MFIGHSEVFFQKIYFEFQYFLIASAREMRLNIIAK